MLPSRVFLFAEIHEASCESHQPALTSCNSTLGCQHMRYSGKNSQVSTVRSLRRLILFESECKPSATSPFVDMRKNVCSRLQASGREYDGTSRFAATNNTRSQTTEQSNKQPAAERQRQSAARRPAAEAGRQAGSKKEDASAKQKRSVPGLRTWSPTVLLAWLEPA